MVDIDLGGCPLDRPAPGPGSPRLLVLHLEAALALPLQPVDDVTSLKQGTGFIKHVLKLL